MQNAPSTTSAEAAPRGVIRDETLRQGRILLIDNDVASLCLLENILTRLGFMNLKLVMRADKAFAHFSIVQPDLVIMEIAMRDFDAFQLIERIRALPTHDSAVPILALSGNADVKSKRRALVVGATDLLVKPFDSSELLMRIRNLLQTRFLYREICAQNEHLEKRVADRTEQLEQTLTELKTAQKQIVQQERFRAFGEMAGGVVHDFNNALMSIIGYSKMLLDEPQALSAPETARKYLQIILTAGQDSSKIVSRLRDFYRPRQNTDVFVNVDLKSVVEEVILLTQPKWRDHARTRGSVVRIQPELEEVPPVLGNSAELREVLVNLVFNAVDAMPEGGVITLRTRKLDGTVVVDVADTGTGMTEEVRQRCLEPFFTTKGEQGTGLGLATVFGIIRRHDGTLEIATKIGAGTTFELKFPSVGAAAKAGPEGEREKVNPLKVLVVDDEKVTRELVVKYLERDSHHVVVASNADEALGKIREDQFDLVLTDLQMPGKSGLDFAREVQQYRSGIPLILFSGTALDTESLPEGVNAFMRKPVSVDELRRVLSSVIQGKGSAAPMHHERHAQVRAA
jgi:signal transduction histidine kinase